MATNKASSTQHHFSPPAVLSRFLSRSSDSIADISSKADALHKQKKGSKPSKMKKSQTALAGFDTKLMSASHSASSLRRRFSLFRAKRSSQSNIESLQQTIDQLKGELQTKANELETLREHIETKRQQPSTESIEQAMQLQAMLNAKLEEMLTENDLLKKSIQDLEYFAQQERSKRHWKGSLSKTTLFDAYYVSHK